MNRGVDCGCCYLVHCSLMCLGKSNGRVIKHYHCPFCSVKEIRRGAFWVHLEHHRRYHVLKNGLGNKKVIEKCHSTITGQNFSHVTNSEKNMCNVTYEGFQVRMLPTIIYDENTVLSEAKLPNCHLCNDGKDYLVIPRLLSHIKRVHLKTHLKLGQLKILLCKLYCGEKHEDRGHYHCIFCEFNGRQKERVEKHIMKHINDVQKRNCTAEYYDPIELHLDYSVPDAWIFDENKEEVRNWESNFNKYIRDIYCKNAKTNNNVLTLKKKCLIYNHLKLNMDIEDKSIKYWVKFRGIKLITCRPIGP